MPHYKDGVEAKVGDLVKGVTYNRKGAVIVGTVISITPGADSCNCMVALTSVKPLPVIPDFSFHEISKHPTVYTNGGGHVMLVSDYDYGELRAFELLHRPD